MRVAAIVGPTAAGKTEVSVDVAERLDAEIVSIDSMQIYRGMDVGTAKPDTDTRSRVPHHLIDIRDPSESVTVAEFQSLARGAIEEIVTRGRLPLLVGGSGLYFRAVVDDLRFPPRSPEIRAALEIRKKSTLHSLLEKVDPTAAARIDPDNLRRVVRALEVIEATGRPFSENYSWDRYESIYDLRVAGLDLDRDRLYERISQRVDRMFALGLEAEVKELAENLGPTARMALGYRQIFEDGESVRGEIVRATKRYARRQKSWFKSDPRIRWFDAGEQGLVGTLVEFFAGNVEP